MRNSLRKNLAIVLIMAFVTILVPSGNIRAAIKESPIGGIDYRRLEALGIIKESDKLGTELYLKRGTLIRLAMRATGYDISEVSENTENPFEDINESNEYYKEALFGHSLGFISAGNVRLYDYATSSEVAKVLCGITGYTELCEKKGGYPAGYMEMAARLKLFPNGGNKVSMMEFFRVLYNAVNVDILEMDSITSGENGGVSYENSTGKTLLTERFGYVYVRGILEEDPHTSIYTKKSADTDKVVIDSAYYSAGSADYTDLLGCVVEAFYDKNDDRHPLVYVGEAQNRNDIITVDLSDVSDVSESGREFTVTYGENEKTEKIKLGRNTWFIYNFEQTAIKKEYLINEKKPGETKEPEEKCGQLRLIDNDLDGDWEVVVVTDYTALQINEIATTPSVIVGKDASEKIELDSEKKSYTFEILKNGNKIKFSDLKKKDIVLYAASTGNAKNHKRVLVSNTVINGELTAKGEDFVSIGSKDYKISRQLYDSVSLGASGAFYLDAFNIIRAVSEVENMVFGFVRKVGKTRGLTSYPVVQIFTENGRWVELETSERVKIDGNAEKAVLLGSSKASMLENMVGTLIKYAVNSDGKLCAIDTAQLIEEADIWSEKELSMIDDNIFRKSRSYQGATYRSGPTSFEDDFTLSGETKIFFVPLTALSENTDDETDYYIGNYSNLVHERAYSSVEVYNLGRNGAPQILVVEDTDKTVAERSQMAVVSGIGGVTLSDGESCDALILQYGSEKAYLPLLSMQVVTDAGGVTSGDIIQYTVNQTGKISAIAKRFDAAGGFEQKFMNSKVYAYSTYFAGQIINVDAENNSLILDYGTKRGVITANAPKVYVYNYTEKTVRTGSLSDIYSSQYIFLRADYLQAKEIFVFENSN